jgi:ADP-L-glycero-D-manno-heptose 6-epimerase
MKVLLTGGAGFIGSCMLKRLNDAGVKDVIVVDHLGASGKWKNLKGKDFRDYFEKDKFLGFLEKGALDRKIDTVIHFGACASTTEQNASYMIENNYIYSKRLAEWAVRSQKRFLYASSGATYGTGEMGYSDSDEITPKLTPLNIYGYSKHLFDLWVLKNKLGKEFVGFKFFNVFGPNEYHKNDMRSMVHKGYHEIKSTGKIRLFKSHKPDYKDGEQKRDFIYVKDAVELVYYFLKHPSKTGIFNIGTGNAKTWNDLAAALFSALNVKANVEYFDMPEILKGKYQYFTQADLGKLKEANPAYKFYGLNEAVQDYVNYLESEAHF